MLSWLRSTITADLAQAKAADEASPGPWVNTGQAGCGDAWQIHGAPLGDEFMLWDWNNGDPIEAPALRRVATLNYDDGGGVWEREAADHMVLQQPRDTIARCEAELRIIALREGDEEHERAYGPDYWTALYLVVLEIASGYKHREGFNPDWLAT